MRGGPAERRDLSSRARASPPSSGVGGRGPGAAGQIKRDALGEVPGTRIVPLSVPFQTSFGIAEGSRMAEASRAARVPSAPLIPGTVAPAWRWQDRACCFPAGLSLSGTRTACPAPSATWSAAGISSLHTASVEGRPRPPTASLKSQGLSSLVLDCQSSNATETMPCQLQGLSLNHLARPSDPPRGALDSLLGCWRGQEGQGHPFGKPCSCEVLWRAFRLTLRTLFLKGPANRLKCQIPL